MSLGDDAPGGWAATPQGSHATATDALHPWEKKSPDAMRPPDPYSAGSRVSIGGSGIEGKAKPARRSPGFVKRTA